jgi:5-methylcytosine-specific restriction protein A
MPRRICLEPGCGSFAEDYLNRRCLVHSKERDGVIHNKDRKRVYNSNRWRYLRRKQLSLNPLCQVCGELATEVHHVIPLAANGKAYDLDNLKSICTSCHSKATRQEMTTENQ